MKAELSKPNVPFRATLRSFTNLGVVRIYATTVVIYVISGCIQPSFLSFNHVMDLLVVASFMGIMAMGQTLVVLTGGLDLSLAYTLNLGAVLMTQLASTHGSVIALVLTVLSGLAIGALNGVGVAYLRIAPIIMTMAMNSILQSVTFVYTNGNPSGQSPGWLQFLGAGKVFGVNMAVVVWVVLSAVVIVVLSKTTFGRKVYSLGTNPHVTFLSGIQNKRVIVTAYTLSGLFAVIAGMMSVGYYGHSFLGMGDTLLLPSLAAVVIGGTSIIGGRGGYAGTAAGAVIIYVLLSILTVQHIAGAGQQIIYGLVLLIVLFLTGRGKRASS